MRGVPILNRKIEQEKSHLSSPGEVIEYKLSPEEIEEKFKGIGQAKWDKPINLSYGCPEKYKNSKGENQMKLTAEMVKEELKNGRTVEQICEKFDRDKRIVNRLYSIAKKELETTYEEQEEKIIVSEEQEMKKEETALKVITKQIDLQGKVLKYRIQDDYVSLLNGGTGVKVELDKLDIVIQELKEISKMAKEA